MRAVLVTGATGTLGRHVVAVLDETAGVTVRILSRRARGADAEPRHEFITADLAVDSLDVALEGVDAVIHLASAKGAREQDVVGTRRLLDAAETARVRHVVVISIIGCDRIPLPFYQSKMGIEELTRGSRLPWSIVRVAQFHSFVERLVAAPAALPLPSPIIADLRFQPVDEREVAEMLVEIALDRPRGYAPEIAGPELLTLAEIAAEWEIVSGRRCSLIPVPLEAITRGAVAEPPRATWVAGTLEGYRSAENTPHGERRLGRVTFADWLRRKAAAQPDAAGTS